MADRLNELKQSRIEARQKAVAARSELKELLETQTAACEAEDRGFTKDENEARKALEKRLAEAEAAELRADEQIAALERKRELEARDRDRSGIADVVETHDNREDASWRSLGEFCQAVRAAHSGHSIDPRLYQAAATGMGTALGPDGGFAIPPEYAEGIERNMYEQGALLSRVSQRPIAGNTMTFNVIDESSRAAGSRQGGVLGYWVDEGTAPTASAIKLAQVEMKLRKVAALGYMTEELSQDAPALEAELQQAFVDELIFMVEDAVINGTGGGQPQGILKAACLVSQAKETGQAAATILTKNLSKMWARLPARSKANVVWLINVDTEPQLDELSIPAGTAALEPRFVTYGPEGTLRIKGRPVVATEYNATLGTVGDIIAADLSKYRLIRKASGVQTASSIHVRFTQGENTFRAIYRVDGQALPRAAVTPFKGSNTLSPFVALATRA